MTNTSATLPGNPPSPEPPKADSAGLQTFPLELRADLDESGAVSRFAHTDDGLKLHALDFGGDGAAMLVLPGITSPAICWEFVARELDGVIRPVVVDLRGRGLSAAPSGSNYSIDRYADDAAAVIAGLELTRPIVLGHSLGARIAASLAVRHPGVAGPLALLDPPLSGPGRDPYPTALSAFVQQLDEARAGTTADAVGAHWPDWPRRELELRARWLGTCDPEAVMATHRGFESEDFFVLWQALPLPALLIRGGRSPVVTDAASNELAALRPDLPIAVVRNAGHMVPWDDLDGFLTALRPFLEEQSERPAEA